MVYWFEYVGVYDVECLVCIYVCQIVEIGDVDVGDVLFVVIGCIFGQVVQEFEYVFGVIEEMGVVVLLGDDGNLVWIF